MNNKNIAETIAIQKTANHIQQHFSILYPMAKKVINDFPSQSGNLNSIIKNIENIGALKPTPMKIKFLNSSDYIECISYMQNIGEQAEIDINNDLKELKETVNHLPFNERQSTYDFSHTLYEMYTYGIGNIYKEINTLISPNTEKNKCEYSK